jgi:hypothetical protein
MRIFHETFCILLPDEAPGFRQRDKAWCQSIAQTDGAVPRYSEQPKKKLLGR